MSDTSLPIISFYSSQNPSLDYQGRSLDEILAYNDFTLEIEHDYIQILFPLPEPSPFNYYATTIDAPTAKAFRENIDVRSNLRRALARMLAFYGFDYQPDTLTIVPASKPNAAFRNWVKRFNHNHLRITRILRSLRTLGLASEAQALLDALLKVNEMMPGKLGQTSLMFWRRAAERPLQWRPEDEDEAKGGRPGGSSWLKDI